MSALIVTSLGDIVVDLYTERCPLTAKNFLKLCKIKYYNGCLFHAVQKDFTAQTGDPTGTGAGGDSVYKFLYGDQARFFSDEIHHDLKHSKTGTVAMASAGENLNASQFYFTLRDDLDYLDGKHTVFGEVAEGFETLTRINEAFVDEKNRPYKNIRIKHTYILDDPFDDPPQLAELIPEASPEGKPKDEVDDEVRLEDDWVPMDERLGPAELDEVLRAKEAHSSAVVLETIGDIPDAEIKPPDNVLFVCKLNPVTEDEDLHTIFSRFGTVISAEVIRDFKTGDSLCYAFIEFETNEACEQAYFKMDNALIDDRRIHVDFSQSVAKLWSQYRRKNNEKGQGRGGRGCFKCGSLDHVAKDCTGGPAKHQPSKYILKDNNMLLTGANNSRYEMVFDEDTPISPRREHRRATHVSDDDVEEQKRHRSSEDLKYRDREKKDSGNRHRHKDRNRDDDRHHDTRTNSYPEERRDGTRYKGRRKEQDDDKGDDREYRKQKSDMDSLGDGYFKRNADGSRDERRDGRGYRKRSSDGEYRRDAGEERDYKQRHVYSDSRYTRDKPSDREHNRYKGGREEQEHRRRGTGVDDDHNRRYISGDRR